eukprot:CAMPEP_0175145236 /NCGR_PEP_ID=MMETSP0087-20121206/14634_1 /TAXON_ID=136419 /ORGANISM="Unknown Unknown, Strain D1" /LENGTH=126 /DNA_ID=CAMNT_0016429911 /DNA_START=37 /DNA_END=417 /DNA_ORIENTATION=-
MSCSSARLPSLSSSSSSSSSLTPPSAARRVTRADLCIFSPSSRFTAPSCDPSSSEVQYQSWDVSLSTYSSLSLSEGRILMMSLVGRGARFMCLLIGMFLLLRPIFISVDSSLSSLLLFEPDTLVLE